MKSCKYSQKTLFSTTLSYAWSVKQKGLAKKKHEKIQDLKCTSIVQLVGKASFSWNYEWSFFQNYLKIVSTVDGWPRFLKTKLANLSLPVKIPVLFNYNEGHSPFFRNVPFHCLSFSPDGFSPFSEWKMEEFLFRNSERRWG